MHGGPAEVEGHTRMHVVPFPLPTPLPTPPTRRVREAMRAAKAAQQAEQAQQQQQGGGGEDGDEDFSSHMRRKLEEKRKAMGIEQPAVAAEQQQEQQRQRKGGDEPELDYGEGSEEETDEEEDEEGAQAGSGCLLGRGVDKLACPMPCWQAAAPHHAAPAEPSSLCVPPPHPPCAQPRASGRGWRTRAGAANPRLLWWPPASRSRWPTRSC